MKLETQMNVARNLRTLRKFNCVSQEKLSVDIGICRNTYAAYELGSRTPDAEILYKIARRFGIRMDSLFINDHYIFMESIAASRYYNDDEARLIKMFDELSSFSKGMLMDRAEMLLDWDKSRTSYRMALNEVKPQSIAR